MNKRVVAGILFLASFCVLILGWLWWAGWEIGSEVVPHDDISRKQYKEVQLGDSIESVQHMFGDAYSIIEDESQIHIYRWSIDWNDDGYCEVVFKNGKVVEKEATDMGVTESD